MMPKISGMELLQIVKEHYPELEVVVVTGYASIDTAVEATKLGAADYLPKPFTPQELTEITKKALERRSKKRENKSKSKVKSDKNEVSDIIDVDMPFSTAEVAQSTSKEFVENLTHSDIQQTRKAEKKTAYCRLGHASAGV
jgi:DNA-binding NtrC family response regulator